MSFDAGGLAQMAYNPNPNNAFPSNGFNNPGPGFGHRQRFSNKRLSVALPPTMNHISEDQVDNPTPRTSRSHLLAGLRTQPKTPATPASAPFNHTQMQGLGASQWSDAGNPSYGQDYPHNAAPRHDLASQYGMAAGRQMYALPEQVLAPPSLYDQTEEMDPAVLQQMQMTSFYLAQRQQQLQMQLANLTASAQGMTLNGGMSHNAAPQQNSHNMYAQQQHIQSPIEVPGQPGVYLVYNPLTQGYNYVLDTQAASNTFQPATPTVSVTPPGFDRPGATRARSYTPPKLVNPYENEDVEPLPPPSSTAFRRGHKKAASLLINPQAEGGAYGGARTSSAATFGSQRSVMPTPPMTGTFGPGAARAGEHPIRQPRGPPPLEELSALPTTKHEGSKNFAARQRRAALDSLVRAGTSRRGLSRSSNGSPVSDAGFHLSLTEDAEDDIATAFRGAGNRKMSPIGTEMKEKRSSQGSTDGYFGLSSASSSSEGEDVGMYKQPPTPATPGGTTGVGSGSGIYGADGARKMMYGVLSATSAAAEKRKSAAGVAY